jgi:hypothetical protein
MNNEPLTRGPETQPLSDSTPRRVPPKWVVDGWTDAEPSHAADPLEADPGGGER